MDIDIEELIEKNKKTVFDYLSTTIEVLTENREVEDEKEIDWYRLSEYLGMEMLERCRDFSK
jgi:siroheme synthase (precorrin-2 oxidase/ferrochelatase)